MKTKVRFRNIIKAAGIFVASIVGTGFATGQEILQFFTLQGRMSIIGCLVSTVVFSLFGALTMKHGYENKLYGPDDTLAFYFPKYSVVFTRVLQILMFCFNVIMISGAGALVDQCFGIPAAIGRTMCGILILCTVLLGVDKFSNLMGFVGPVIILVVFIVAFTGLATGNGSLAQADAILEHMELVKTPGGWLWSAILYPCFNSMVMVIILCTTGSRLQNKAESVCGGILGGILFGAGVLLLDLGFLRNVSDISSMAIPSLTIIQRLGNIPGSAFSFLILLAICVGSGPGLWTAASCFGKDGSKRFAVGAVALSIASQILAITDFRKLVNIVYPFTGYLGLALILLIVFRELTSLRKPSDRQ